MNRNAWIICVCDICICLSILSLVLQTPVLADATDLMKEMQREMQQDEFWGFFNYWLAIVLFGIAVVSSILATLGSATEQLRKKFGGWIAVFAAVPALALMIDSVFKWDAKAEWHWQKEREVMVLVHELRDRGASAKQVSAALDKLEDKMAKERPQMSPAFSPREETQEK